MKPILYMCWTCQQNSTAILCSANCSEEDKSYTINAAEEHLTIVQVKRCFYKTTCDNCRKSVWAHFTKDGRFTSAATLVIKHCSEFQGHPGALHFRLGPASSLSFQPWSNLLPHPSKCTVFGMNCEVSPRQVNFLTDDAGECGNSLLTR